MQTEIKVNTPQTVYIKFLGNLPRKFTVYDSKGKLYFERYLDGKTPRIKFNIPNVGVYYTKNPIEIVKQVAIEIPSLSFSLPAFERNRIRDFVIIDNPKLQGTPARVFTFDGIIEKGAAFNRYTNPMKVFFLLHEVGHFYYKTEEYCDLFALVHFLQMGYNMSTAMYCLTTVLRRNKQNQERVMFIYKQMFKK
jgi:hypothetical protein